MEDSIKIIEKKYMDPNDDDGFTKWMAEDDMIKPTAPVTKQALFRVPTPRAKVSRLSTSRSGSKSRPPSTESERSIISSEGNPDQSSEDFLAIDPLAAQALRDLKEALGLAIQVRRRCSCPRHSIKKIVTAVSPLS